MALKKCKECGHKVSSKAKTCPNCGVTDPTTTASDKALGCLFVIILLLGTFSWLISENDDINSNADGFSTLSLNVRQGPSTNYEVVTSLRKGEQVRFLKDSLGWKLIELIERDDNPTGWASSKYLSEISEFSSFHDEISSPDVYQLPPTREEIIESQFSAWDGSHRNLEKYIKKNMNDPDSYEHVQTVYWDQGDYLVVKTTFRGNNAFGGKVKNDIKAKITIDGVILEIVSP
tara:strand:+ start:495 stop:1190 length:696 start_codon:yes stop_codon:yes gene_type:complete